MLDVSADQGKFRRCIRLVIADRQPIVLQGLKSVFAAQHDFEIVASCSLGTSCLEAIRNWAPDVALLADTLPDLTASEILAIATAENLPTRLVFFAESEGNDDLTAAIATGACGAISKYATPDTMLRSLRLMAECTSASPERAQNRSPNGKESDRAKIQKKLGLLTHRESQIVRLVSEGLSNKEIARKLNVSQGTVKVHLYNIFQKLEISNRTVLATIAVLRGPAGFTTLSLAALAFAILSDVKASANDALLDNDSATIKDPEHPIFELWKKAILRHVIVTDPGDTFALTQRSSSSKESQVTHSAKMEGLQAAEQVALSNFGKGYGPIGSSTPSLFISPLLQAINNSQTCSPTAQQQLPSLEFASNPIRSHGGYGTFAMTAAGAGLYALDNSHAAAQAFEPGETLIAASTVAIMGLTTQVATIAIHGASKVDPDDPDGLAPGPVVQASHPPLGAGHDSVTGGGNTGQFIHGGGDDNLNGIGPVHVVYGGSGNDTIKGDGGDHTILHEASGSDGNDHLLGRHGGDQLTGGNGDDVAVYHSAADSNSTQFDSLIDLTSGSDKINLAAFGALAFLHLTSASQSVPPHTLAWIYNPVSNETIVYVNPTDRSLDIGDAGLLEIHLQGVVSVAESDFVHRPDAAAVAAALEGIDPALLAATASDGTVLTTDSVLASIETEASGTAGVWTMPADDGLRFHFGQDRIGTSVSHPSFGKDSAYATEENGSGAVIVPAHVSSIELAHGNATILTGEHPAFNQETAQSNPVTTGHGKAQATAPLEFFDFTQSAATVTPVAVAEPAEPSVAPGNSAGHSNSQHASPQASEKASAITELAEPDVKPGNGVGHDNEQHISNSNAAKTSAAAEPTEPGVTHGHGNSEHPSHAASASTKGAAESIETGVAPGHSAGHGNSQHASQSIPERGSTTTELPEPGAKPGNGAGHGNEQHISNSSAAKRSAAAEPAEPEVTPGPGNSEHPSHSVSASTKHAADPIETGVVPGHSAGHGNGNPQHGPPSASEKTSATAELAESDVKPHNGVGHGNEEHISNSNAAKTSAAAEPTGPDVTPGQGNSEHPSHSASASTKSAALPTETGVDPGNGAGHGNSQHASQSASAKAVADTEPAEPDATSGNGVGHGNVPHASDSAKAKDSATTELAEPDVTPGPGNSTPPSHAASAKPPAITEPVEPGAASDNGMGHGQAFHFKDQVVPSTPTAAIEPGELNDPLVSLGPAAHPATILDVGPAAMEEHAASHANNGVHHATHLPHELLI